jgi:uncharacterized metal-binding protein YceD (DUF177 family)
MTFIPALVDESHPLEIREDLGPDLIGLNEASARAEQPVKADLRVEKEEGNYLVTGWLQTTLTLQCGRCTEWFPLPLKVEVGHLFEPPHPASIDLTPLLREDILLELPLNAACRLGADGRCPVTGEVYQPRPETSGPLAGEAVWEALNKVKPKE